MDAKYMQRRIYEKCLTCDRGQSEGGCRCHTGRMRGLVQPRLLLQLARKPAHGYELMEALGEGTYGQVPDRAPSTARCAVLKEDGLVHLT